jgi:thiosulfate dehydrogenase [quinone] large subunit
MGHNSRLRGLFDLDQLPSPVEFSEPPIARLLFHSTRAGLLWVPVRVYLGYEWARAGLDQVADQSWMDGSTVLAFWWDAVDRGGSFDETSAVAGYRAFLNLLIDAGASQLFARLIAFGELAVGAALILGAFVGIAAFFGALMNMNFMLAGTASSNPVLFAGAIGLMLAWRVAGYYGLDRLLLPTLGTPWVPQAEPGGRPGR